MRVLIFSTAYLPHVGGAEVALKEITHRMRDVNFSARGGPAVGWDMFTVKLDKSDKAQEKIGSINVYRLGWGIGRADKLLFPFRAARLAGRLHKKNNYDVVWSMMASFSGFAALFFKKKHPGVKFLLTLQEGDDLAQVERKVWFVKFWFRQIFTRADYIQAISHYLADWAKYMGAKCPIEVVPNGVSAIYDLRFLIYDLRQKLGILDDEKIILTTSRLVQKNGIDTLLRALAILQNHKSKIINHKLVICGTGVELNNLKSKIKNLKLEDKVKLVGFVPPEELPSYYAAADVFCRPSLSEGLGNSFLEAMSYGVPVVATPVGGIVDFLEDGKPSSAKATAGKTGWFCEVNNPQSIAEKITYILDEKNKDEVARVVRNAKTLVEEKYNWDSIAQRMRRIFAKLS